MAFLELKNVRIAGFSAGVPRKRLAMLDAEGLSADYDAAAFMEATGIEERRIDELTTSDLCVPAAERLLNDLHWDKSEIEAVVFVSQTADYICPATACIIQDRLGLSRECYAEDVSLGCSGWVYGLSNIVSLMASGCIKKALLMAGDARRHFAGDKDPLFGYAGTVTALEYDDGNPGFKFHFGTDGSGFDAIIIPDGGSRNVIDLQNIDLQQLDEGGGRLQVSMKGMDVFSFGITTAPKSVKRLAERFGFDYLDADYFVFHQANKKMNDTIAKKLKLDNEKVPMSIQRFGNTSSASIPLTIVTQLKGKVENQRTKFICCGFGIGLSWGTVAFETNNITISDLVEVSEEETDKQHVV